MYTRVIKEDCIACGLCSAFAEQVFEYDKEGYAYNSLDNNLGTFNIESDLERDVVHAHEACPADAIEISNAPFDSK